MNQVCKTCKGTGASSQMVTTKEGKVVLAPPYQKGEGDKPQFQNCDNCEGSGWALYDAPNAIVFEGQKVQLTEEEKRARFQDTLF